MTISGPPVEFTAERNYWVDTRITPEIKSGSAIDVTLTSSKPGSSAILVFPSTPDGDMTGPSILAETLPPETSLASWHLTAPQDSNYMFVVSTWNSSYILTIESAWSPFKETRMALLVGFVVAFGGGLLEYYHRTTARQRQMLMEALGEGHR